MTIQGFVEKAIEGGWMKGNMSEYVTYHQRTPNNGSVHVLYTYHELLDPEAWKAVGKVEGWAWVCPDCEHTGKHSIRCKEDSKSEEGWLYFMHRMIDALGEGGTIESYLASL